MKKFTKEEIIKNVLERIISDLDQSIEGLKEDAEIYKGNLYSVIQNTADAFIETREHYKERLNALLNGYEFQKDAYMKDFSEDVEFIHYLDEYLRSSYDMYKQYGGETKNQEREIIFATLSVIETYGFPVDTRYISMEPMCPDLDKKEAKGKEVKIIRLKDVPDILNVLYTENIEDFSVIFNPSEKSTTARKILTYKEAMKRPELLDREVDTIDICEEESCLNIWLK